MTLRSLLLTATVLAIPGIAWADPVDGLYIAGGAGATWFTSQDTKSLSVAGVSQSSFNGAKALFNTPGFVGVGSIGYGLGNGLRLELEGSYRQDSLHKFDRPNAAASAGQQLPGNGSEQVFGPMVNAFYDFDISPYVTPYLGVGAGYQFDQFKVNTVSSSSSYDFSGTHGDFAFQGIAGVAVPIPMVPGLALTVEYRFLDALTDHSYGGSYVSGGTTSAAKIKVGDLYDHSALVGLRYAFGVAPAAPAPIPVAVPAAQPARSYLVFFDWDKATLTDRARQIIADAASNIPKVQHTQIEVNGYTDTSGTPKYNQGLSIRRAQVVAAELVRLGVAKSEIAIQGFGETHLLVPTAAGVREPQNRRVEIIIR